jgi:hypothetical protein
VVENNGGRGFMIFKTRAVAIIIIIIIIASVGFFSPETRRIQDNGKVLQR